MGFFKRKFPNRSSFRKCRWKYFQVRLAFRTTDRKTPAKVTYFPHQPLLRTRLNLKAESLLCFTIWGFLISESSLALFQVTFPLSSSFQRSSWVIMQAWWKLEWCCGPCDSCHREWGQFLRCCSFGAWGSWEFLKSICTFSTFFDGDLCTVRPTLFERKRPST